MIKLDKRQDMLSFQAIFKSGSKPEPLVHPVFALLGFLHKIYNYIFVFNYLTPINLLNIF